MKRRIVLFLIMLMLAVSALNGCDAKKSENIGNIDKITLVCTAGDINKVEMYVVASDLFIKHYDIAPYADSRFDLFAGQLPSKEEYTVKEWQISEESWNDIADVLSANDFMALPEEIVCSSQAFDAPSYYIEVETAGVVHRVGGYNAGQAKDSVNRRFRSILDSLEDNFQADKYSGCSCPSTANTYGA